MVTLQKKQWSLPYGIPKRTNKKTKPPASVLSPYPFFLPTDTDSIFSFFSRLFSDCKAENGPVGFMPCVTPTQTQTSPFDVIAVSSPIDYNAQDHDASSSYSSSSSESSLSMESEETGNSTHALSDILCDHYVQTQQSHSSELINVPLETFRIFEAPPTEEQYWMETTNREWTLVETLSKPSKRLQKPQAPEKAVEPKPLCHDRDIRSNTAYLRMIVAEVNMMRSQKIVGPLRPRRVLPKRTDRFMPRPSPLQLVLV
ncbi:hypothetical protein EDC96DRAFT_527142 [Choanephora cucurbitarum]|nr:hypothetical protein EDC96DRAFT_527142 [Choanephora cucurbitarum]